MHPLSSYAMSGSYSSNVCSNDEHPDPEIFGASVSSWSRCLITHDDGTFDCFFYRIDYTAYSRMPSNPASNMGNPRIYPVAQLRMLHDGHEYLVSESAQGSVSLVAHELKLCIRKLLEVTCHEPKDLKKWLVHPKKNLREIAMSVLADKFGQTEPVVE